jgi:hypothetical protein
MVAGPADAKAANRPMPQKTAGYAGRSEGREPPSMPFLFLGYCRSSIHTAEAYTGRNVCISKITRQDLLLFNWGLTPVKQTIQDATQCYERGGLPDSDLGSKGSTQHPPSPYADNVR